MSSPSYGYGVLPTGQSAPVESIDSTHHGAWVVIATALGLVLGTVCLLIRLYVRVIITPPWSRDDYVHGAATVLLAHSKLPHSRKLMALRLWLLYNPSLCSSKSRKDLVPR